MRAGRTQRIPIGLARGLRLEVDQRASLHIYLGTAEIEIARHIQRLARPGYRCFDVGGYNACYAMVFARLTGEEVVSFEFDETALARMERNLANNPGVASNIRICPIYVAHETNPLKGVATLDDLIASEPLGVPDFVKVDVEGAESLVLRGAVRLLDHRRPHLIVETHSRDLENECAELLIQHGYAPKIIAQRKRLQEARLTAHNRWLVAEGLPSACQTSG